MSKSARRPRVGIGCQGGGSHNAFTAGVLEALLEAHSVESFEIRALSGASGGAVCAAMAWDGLLRGQPERGIERLDSLWRRVAAHRPIDWLINECLRASVAIREFLPLPEVSPYFVPSWAQDQLRGLLLDLLDFDELRALAVLPGATELLVGAVEVVSGRFEIFHGPELTVDGLLASTAIPEFFRAVEVPGRGIYWDGLLSQNPPIHDLTAFGLDEIWVIQTNPPNCPHVPTGLPSIADRRNELAGSLSLEQELYSIDTINRLLASGELISEKYRPIRLHRIVLARELGVVSKLDRSPAFLDALRQEGRSAARRFLEERREGSARTARGKGIA